MNSIKLIHKVKEILNFHISEPASLNQDVGFRAIGLAHIDWKEAANEVQALFEGQWKNGMLPHLIFGAKTDKEVTGMKDFWEIENSPNSPDLYYTSGITQLPIYGLVLQKIYELAEEKEEAKSFLKEMYPKIHAFHKYLYTFRDDEDEGLVAVIHPNESRTEGSPLWDSVLDKIAIGEEELVGVESREYDYLRYVDLISLYQEYKFDEEKIAQNCPFRVQDPFFNAVLSWSNEAMIEIGRIIGEDVTDFVLWNELTVFSMNEKLWDEEQGIYNAYDVVNEAFIQGETLSGMLPMMTDIPNIDQAENILINLQDEYFSGTKENPMYLCPTYDVTAEDVRFNIPERGAVSICQNWLLYQGLKRFEMHSMAEKVKDDSLELIGKYGFYTSFNPLKERLANFENNKEDILCAALCLDFFLDEK